MNTDEVLLEEPKAFNKKISKSKFQFFVFTVVAIALVISTILLIDSKKVRPPLPEKPKKLKSFADNHWDESYEKAKKLVSSLSFDEKVSLISLLHLTITDISCKKSIKANHIMSKSEIDGLIRDLARCNNPANCPHGRPTLLKLTKEDIEKIFRRSGF